ncbi:299_t:CDS:2, partial [Funneliformis geosporum]
QSVQARTRYNWQIYAEVSEPKQEVIRWKDAFKTSKVGNDCMSVDELYSMKHLETLCIIEYTNYPATCALVVGTTGKSKQSTVINHFWKLQNERQNIVVKNALIEDKTNMQENKAKAKVQKLQADQHVTIAMVTTGQIQQYAKSTTTKISKKFLNEKERTVKRTRTYKESNNNDNTENDHLLLLDEKSSTVSTQDQFSLMINHPMMNLRMTETMLIIKSMMIVKNSPFSLLGRNDTKDGTQIPPHQITGNTFFAQSSASETHESILRASSENLTGLNKVKVCITNALIVNDEDTEEITRLKKYLYRVMLPLIESFLKPIPDISAQTVVNITIGRSSDIVFSLMLYKNLQ